jgi:hypothetical protein
MIDRQLEHFEPLEQRRRSLLTAGSRQEQLYLPNDGRHRIAQFVSGDRDEFIPGRDRRAQLFNEALLFNGRWSGHPTFLSVVKRARDYMQPRLEARTTLSSTTIPDRGAFDMRYSVAVS